MCGVLTSLVVFSEHLLKVRAACGQQRSVNRETRISSNQGHITQQVLRPQRVETI